MRPLLIFLLFLTSCSTSNEEFSGTEMTMGYQIKIEQKLKAHEKSKIKETICACFSTIDRIFNNWNPLSEISRLNQLPAYQKVEVSKELAYLLHKIDTLVTVTEGRFDPTVEPLQKLYKAYFSKRELPPAEKLEALYPAIGWDNIHLEGTTFWKEHAQTALDLSGVAKGYAVDLLTEKLQELGYENLYVEWGGEIKTAGSHKDGRCWQIAIMGGEVIGLQNQAIATSGDLYQRWTINGVTYTHIIDPKTMQPLRVTTTSIPSAAVVSDLCSHSDALATALMLFPSAQEARLWAQKKGLTTCIIE